VFADVVGGVAGDFDVADGGVLFVFSGLDGDAVVAIVAGVGRDAEAGGALFVLGDDPGVTFFCGGVPPLEGALVGAAPEVLQRDSGECLAFAEQW